MSPDEFLRQEDEYLLNNIYGDKSDAEVYKPQNPSFKEFFEKKKDNKIYEDDPFVGEKIPESILWHDFDKKVFEEKSWRIKNLIPKEGFVILASISGNRKTWLAIEMAKAISLNENFLNEEEFKTEGANVLYINAENSESEMHRRGRQLGITLKPPVYNLRLVNADNINLNTDEGEVWLKSHIEFDKISVVFIDTFIAVGGGIKEDKSDEVRQFFNRYCSLKNSGVVLVWLMHMRKPTNFEGKIPKKEMLLGSQDKVASVEVLLMLHSESGSDLINVYQRKNRLAVEIPPFKVSMKDTTNDEGRKITVLAYEGPIEEQENKREQAKELILGILESDGKTTNQILEMTKKSVGSKNTRVALSELVNAGLIELTKQGKQNYYLLPKGELEVEGVGGDLNKNDLGFFTDQ